MEKRYCLSHDWRCSVCCLKDRFLVITEYIAIVIKQTARVKRNNAISSDSYISFPISTLLEFYPCTQRFDSPFAGFGETTNPENYFSAEWPPRIAPKAVRLSRCRRFLHCKYFTHFRRPIGLPKLRCQKLRNALEIGSINMIKRNVPKQTTPTTDRRYAQEKATDL
jgi:hypothetical protein